MEPIILRLDQRFPGGFFQTLIGIRILMVGTAIAVTALGGLAATVADSNLSLVGCIAPPIASVLWNLGDCFVLRKIAFTGFLNPKKLKRALIFLPILELIPIGVITLFFVRLALPTWLGNEVTEADCPPIAEDGCPLLDAQRYINLMIGLIYGLLPAHLLFLICQIVMAVRGRLVWRQKNVVAHV